MLRGTSKLAGSALRMNEAIGNVVRLGAASLADAIRMATINPSRLVNLPESFGRAVLRETATGIEIADVVIDAQLP